MGGFFVKCKGFILLGGAHIFWEGFAFCTKGLYLVGGVCIPKGFIFCALGSFHILGGVYILWEGFIFCDHGFQNNLAI